MSEHVEAGWQLARYEGRSDIYMWSPPWPMFVTGLRFSRAVGIKTIHVGLECVATDHIALARAHPDLKQCELVGECFEWSPEPLHPGFELYVGQQIVVQLRASVYWAELLHRPLGEVEVSPSPPPTEREDRRQKFVQQCLDNLQVSSSRRYPELEPLIIPTRRPR